MFTFPSRNKFIFDEIIFDSNFCSGNLKKVERLDQNFYRVYVANDNMGRDYETEHKMFFYFSIENVPINTTLRIQVDNIIYFANLYHAGFKPVFKNKFYTWDYIPGECRVITEDNVNFIEFNFEFLEDGPHFFAFTFPFSYEDCNAWVQQLEINYKKHDKIYFHRTLLCKSAENRNVEILTISSYKYKTSDSEGICSYLKDKASQPASFRNKKYVLLTCRVHPGEVTGQWAFNGLIEFLLQSDNYHAQELRDNFVFKCIPMINPDGVSRGHMRMDARGNNLNRWYLTPNKYDHPNTYYIRELALGLSQRHLFYFYMDFHAHGGRKGNFLYGNFLSYWESVEAQYFAKLMSINTVNFDFENSIFSEKMMACKDKLDNMSREGAGRVSMQKISKSPYCYTLECTYDSSEVFNQLSAFWDSRKDVQYYPTNNNVMYDQIQDNNSEFYKRKPTLFVRDVFMEVGVAAAISLLDLFNINKISRVQTSEYGNLVNVYHSIASRLIEQIPYRLDFNLRKEAKVKIDTLNYDFFKGRNKLKSSAKKEQEESEKDKNKLKRLKNAPADPIKIKDVNIVFTTEVKNLTSSPAKNIVNSVDVKSEKYQQKMKEFSQIHNQLYTKMTNDYDTHKMRNKSAGKIIRGVLVSNSPNKLIKNSQIQITNSNTEEDVKMIITKIKKNNSNTNY